MSELSENIMTPMNYLKIFFRRKEFIILPVFAGLIIGICVSLVLPKQYISSTILLVEEGKSDNPLFSQLAVSTNVSQRMSTIRESMLGWNSLVKLVKRLKMDKDIKTPQEFETLILSLRRKINISLRGHNIINVSFLHENPELTRDVVQNITDIFIERNVEIQNENTSDAISFIEGQLNVYKGKIKSSEIAKLKDDLNILLTDSTEQHPKVKQLREQIKVKERELKKENLTYTENISLENQSNNPIISEIKKALDNMEGGGDKIPTPTPAMKAPAGEDFYKVMLIEKLDSVMARDVGVNNQIYNMLLQRLETAKITQRLQSSKEGTKYTILDPPRIPFQPIKPNKILVSLGGLLAGLILGAALVVVLEFLDKSFLDVEEATQYFGTPLLGAISKINTETNVRKAKEREYWIYGLTIVVGISAVMLTIAISNFKG